jgi:hypothetical protein
MRSGRGRVGARRLTTLAVLVQSALRRTGPKTVDGLLQYSAGATEPQIAAACAELVNLGEASFDSVTSFYSLEHRSKLRT